MTHLQINGDLAISTCDTVGSVSMCDGVMQLLSETCDRPGSQTYTLSDPAYYIKATYDINNEIAFNSGGNDPTALGCDDSWYIPTAFTVNDDNGSDVTYNIGDGADTAQKAIATLTACDDLGRTCDSTVFLTLSMTAGGVLSSTVNTSYEAGFSGVAVEDTAVETIAYWPNSDENHTNIPEPDGAGGDVSQVELLKSHFTAYFNDQIEDVNSQFNGKNIVESWQITVDALAASTTNTLSVFGHTNSRATDDLFSAGDKIVLSRPKTLTYSVTNANGANLDVFSGRNVYGVLQQSA